MELTLRDKDGKEVKIFIPCGVTEFTISEKITAQLQKFTPGYWEVKRMG